MTKSPNAREMFAIPESGANKSKFRTKVRRMSGIKMTAITIRVELSLSQLVLVPKHASKICIKLAAMNTM